MPPISSDLLKCGTRKSKFTDIACAFFLLDRIALRHVNLCVECLMRVSYLLLLQQPDGGNFYNPHFLKGKLMLK